MPCFANHLFSLLLFSFHRVLYIPEREEFLYNVVSVSAIQQSEGVMSHMTYASLLPPPTPLGHHKVPDWAPCII